MVSETVNDPDPEPLPEGHPDREAWVKRIMSRSLNPDGSPLPSVRQTERVAPSHEGPFIVRRERA